MLGLAVGGFVLSNAFRNAALDNFDASLEHRHGWADRRRPARSTMAAWCCRTVSSIANSTASIPGLYYQIKPVKPGEPGGQISRSLFDHGLAPTAEAKQRRAHLWLCRRARKTSSCACCRGGWNFPIASTPDQNDSRAYTFMVAGDLAAVDAESSAFNGTLIWSFVLLGLGLVVAILLQVRIGLLPLRRLKDALHRIRDGKAQQLEGEFPAEIAPLAAELNSLIEHSAEIVARARTHVSNLAHFLKTPLSVLASEAEAASAGARWPIRCAARSDVMRRQVDHYLARARAAGSVNVLGNRTQVAPVLNDLARVLTRIHAARDIVIDAECPPALYFRGERQDLEEMAGNLMDNACKWAQQPGAGARRGGGAAPGSDGGG